MEGLAQNKRTENHVKRVSCRSYSFNNLPVISLVLVICFTPPAQAGDISCQGIRYTYFNKGLDTSHIPAVPQQGKKFISTFFRLETNIWGDFTLFRISPSEMYCSLIAD